MASGLLIELLPSLRGHADAHATSSSAFTLDVEVTGEEHKYRPSRGCVSFHVESPPEVPLTV